MGLLFCGSQRTSCPETSVGQRSKNSRRKIWSHNDHDHPQVVGVALRPTSGARRVGLRIQRQPGARVRSSPSHSVKSSPGALGRHGFRASRAKTPRLERWGAFALRRISHGHVRLVGARPSSVDSQHPAIRGQTFEVRLPASPRPDHNSPSRLTQLRERDLSATGVNERRVGGNPRVCPARKVPAHQGGRSRPSHW
jgi:hypothetical protein